MEIGKIEVSYEGFFNNPIYEVCYEINKFGYSSHRFKNIELALIFSEIIKLKNMKKSTRRS